MTLMVRQSGSGDNGLPLEIYAFTNTVVWLEYESIQADIFDPHLRLSKSLVCDFISRQPAMIFALWRVHLSSN